MQGNAFAQKFYKSSCGYVAWCQISRWKIKLTGSQYPNFWQKTIWIFQWIHQPILIRTKIWINICSFNKNFIYSSNSYSYLVRWTLPCQFYRWRNWVSEKTNDLSDTQELVCNVIQVLKLPSSVCKPHVLSNSPINFLSKRDTIGL